MKLFLILATLQCIAGDQLKMGSVPYEQGEVTVSTHLNLEPIAKSLKDLKAMTTKVTSDPNFRIITSERKNAFTDFNKRISLQEDVYKSIQERSTLLINELDKLIEKIDVIAENTKNAVNKMQKKIETAKTLAIIGTTGLAIFTCVTCGCILYLKSAINKLRG